MQAQSGDNTQKVLEKMAAIQIEEQLRKAINRKMNNDYFEGACKGSFLRLHRSVLMNGVNGPALLALH